MNAAIDFLSREGPMILAGGTVLLAAGALATAGQRSPAARQRAAELTMLGVVVWLAIASVPLPRHEWSRSLSTGAEKGEARDVGEFAAPPAVADKDGSVEAHSSPKEVDAALIEVPEELLMEALRERRLSTYPVRDRIDADQPATAPGEAGRPAGTGNVDWRRLGARIYLFGAIGSLAWLLLGHGLLWRVLRLAEPADSWLSELLVRAASNRTSGEPGKALPRLLMSRHCRRPFSCGLWRPTIVLPQRLCRPEEGERLRSMLLHELAHVLRSDAWGHQLFHLGLPLWFFHPSYWYLRWAAQLSRELIADDWAARHSSPEVYVRQLIALARETGLGPAPAAVPAIFSSRTQFYRRMTMLIRRESPLATRCTLVWRSVSCVLAALAVGLAAWSWGVAPTAAQVAPPVEDKAIDNRNPLTSDAKRPKPLALDVAVEVVDDKEEKPAEDKTPSNRVDDVSDETPAATDAQRKKLEAELAQLEAQLRSLRDRLAEIEPGASDPLTRKTRRANLKMDIRSLRDSTAPGPTDKPSREPAEELLSLRGVPGSNGDKRAAEPAADAKGKQRGDDLGTNSYGGRVGIIESPGTVRESAEAAVGGLHLDLVRLVEAYADAAGDVEIAKARLAQAMAVAQAPNPSPAASGEIRIQEITVRSAERKFASLRRIAEVVTSAADEEAHSCEEELQHLRRLYEKGYVSEGEVLKAARQHQAAQANVKALRSILAE